MSIKKKAVHINSLNLCDYLKMNKILAFPFLWNVTKDHRGVVS